jgi:hypothetical protein
MLNSGEVIKPSPLFVPQNEFQKALGDTVEPYGHGMHILIPYYIPSESRKKHGFI